MKKQTVLLTNVKVILLMSVSKQELLDLVFEIINLFLYLFRPTSNFDCYRYADKTVMPVFVYKIQKKK